MIGYLEGKILHIDSDRMLVLANQVGYEVLLPANVMASLNGKAPGDEVSFFIYCQQTERQPKPVLIGFNNQLEKAFFQQFITVDAIGPLKAVKALENPVAEIAAAIESGDVAFLKRLSGIGARTAHKIIASLKGKMELFVTLPMASSGQNRTQDNVIEQVHQVLTDQLGHKEFEARQLIADAISRKEGISTPEELIDEIYRGEGAKK